MVSPERVEARPYADDDGQGARAAALQAPWRADAETLAHREPQEVETADMNQQTLQDVVVSPQVRAAHLAGLIEVGKRLLGEFYRSPPRASPTGAPVTAAIPIDGRVRIRRVGPTAPPTVGFRNVRPQAHRGQVYHRRRFPLMSGARCVRGVYLFGRRNRRRDGRPRVALICALHRRRDQRAALQIDRRRGLRVSYVRPSFVVASIAIVRPFNHTGGRQAPQDRSLARFHPGDLAKSY